MAHAEPSPTNGAAGRFRRWPRPETALLALGLLLTAAVKLHALRRLEPEGLLAAWAAVTVADVAFFGAAALLLAALPLIGRRAAAARAAILLAVLVLGWSAANAAWLFASRGAQLHPGVLAALAADPLALAPGVLRRPAVLGAVAIAAVVGLVVLGRWVLRPAPDRRTGPALVARMVVAAVLAAVAAVVALRQPVGAGLGVAGESLAFSSHAQALRWMVGLGPRGDVTAPHRALPRAGERHLSDPPPDAARPNVLIVMLESVPHSATTLADPALTTTPRLAALAAEGAEMVETRVPVALTSKAFWATLTGSVPDMQPDYAEAVPVDAPYESLATILRGAGYRSGFFEMSRGGFQCAAGLFANLGFDTAWFRENLGDPDAHLTDLTGDDRRLIDPAFRWAGAEPGPFLLAMITTVAHAPYTVPPWFGAAIEDEHAAFEQSLRYTDAFLGAVLDRLEAEGLADDTIVCVLGDHGEGFRVVEDSSRFMPWEEIIRVPWVLRWPGRVEPGSRITWPCAQTDVAPTLLSLIGYDVADAGFDGRDALRPAPADRRVRFGGWYPRSPSGFTEGFDKYVHDPRDGTVVRYDLRDDPAETAPLPVDAATAAMVAADVTAWRRASQVRMHPARFRARVVFGDWQTWSVGRNAWAYHLDDRP